MRRLAAFLLAIAAVACGQSRPAAQQPRGSNDVHTLESADSRPALLDPPPVLAEEAPPPKPLDPIAAQNQVPLTEADEQLRAQLPFAPAIAMDPVTGQKLSIRAETPTFETKTKVYYFASEENKRLFAANPEQYIKGPFSHL